MPLPDESFEINIGDALYFPVIQSHATFQVKRACFVIEISLAQIECVAVKPYSKFSPASRTGELDVNVPMVNTILKRLHILLWSQTSLNRMVSL
jgi:hypothetical protein